jgi:DNA-binding NarL/FixJ family response regulator
LQKNKDKAMLTQSDSRTVLIHCRNALFGTMLRDGLNRCDMFVTHPCVGDAADLAAAVQRHRPAVLLTEPRPTADDIEEMARAASDWLPDLACVAYLPAQRRNSAKRCLAAGYAGVVSQGSDFETLIQALSIVVQHGIFVDRAFLEPASAPDQELSRRERLVLEQLARGFSDKEIANRLQLSAKTVQTYKNRGFRKLGLHRKHEVVEYAINHDWLS